MVVMAVKEEVVEVMTTGMEEMTEEVMEVSKGRKRHVDVLMPVSVPKELVDKKLRLPSHDLQMQI